MRKFQFKFSTILNHRKIAEEAALRQLAEAQRKHQQALSAKSKLQADLALSLGRREELGTLAVPVVAFRIEQDFINGTKQRIIQADQAITRAVRGVEKALRFYLHTRRQTQMMERLREKHYEEFKRARNKKEQSEMDDLTVMRSHLKENNDEEEVA